MSFLLDFRAFCEGYPFTYTLMIICGIICFVPSILLLLAVLQSSIHSNCRILMCLWIVAQLLVYATVSWLAVTEIVNEKSYFKQQFLPTDFDLPILPWYLPAWLITTCFELGISLERGISIQNPSRYHESSPSYAKIFAYSIFSVLFSYRVGTWILFGPGTVEAALGTIFSNLMDVGAFSTNVIVLIFAGRKNKDEHKQLNERYQIQETYQIARSMMPVYCMSTAIKANRDKDDFHSVVMVIANWMFVMDILPHSVTQTVYICLSELSCGVTSTMFLLHHVRLRAKLNKILGRANKVSPIVVDHHERDTVDHFQMLIIAWNR